MALVQLALPGAAYVYNGDELGLPDADLPDEARRDAVWHHGEDSRDGCRVPQPWEEDLPAYGFTTGEPWLPIPDEYAALNAAAQLEDTGSTLSLYRRALELRRLHPGIHHTGGAGPSARVVRRPTRLPGVPAHGHDPGMRAQHLLRPGRAAPGDPLLVSGPLDDGMLPPDTAVWLA